jgi:endoglycosylceramidase
MARPSFDNFVYAPHFYDPVALKTRRAWIGETWVVGHAFATMRARASSWGVPLFVGEFGMHAEAEGAADYMEAVYGELDDGVTSGAQWNFTPGWTPATKDGWNAEDLSILDEDGAPRANYEIRPRPAFTAGTPGSFTVGAGDGTIDAAYAWTADGTDHATEITIPAALHASRVEMSAAANGVSCAFAAGKVTCHGGAEGAAASVTIHVTL